MAEFTADHQAWFRLWRPLGQTVPTDDTYRRLVPETAMKATLLLRDGTCLPGLQKLIWPWTASSHVGWTTGPRARGFWSVPSWCGRG